MVDPSFRLTLSACRSPVSLRGWCVCVFLVFACFLAVAVALHYPGFYAGTIYDTNALLLSNAPVFSRHDIREVVAITPQRPLFMVSLYVNYVLSGMDPPCFRLVNAAILAAAGLALTVLMSVLVASSPSLRHLTDVQRHYLSILTGLTFVVHPVQSLVVLYIWQREAIMACLFYYMGLAAYVTARSGTWGHQRVWYVATSLFVLGGLLSKENVVSFPLTALIAEWVFFRGNIRQLARQAVTIVVIVAIPFMVQLLMVWSLHQPETPLDHQGILVRLQSYYEKAELPLSQIVLTQCRVWFSYLFMILDPFVQGIQLLDAKVVSRSLWNPPITMAATLGVVGLVGAAVGLAKRLPLSAFGILFMIVTLLPESLFIPQYLFCGYRAILPMAGVLMVGAEGLSMLMAGPVKRAVPWAVSAMVLVIVLLLGVTTFRQATSWSPLSVWKDAYSRLPEYSPDVEKYPYMDVLTGYASELDRSGQYPAAIELFKDAMQVEIDAKSDKTALAMGNLGMALIKNGNVQEGIRYLEDVIERFPRGAWARYNLGVALINTGRNDEGMQHLREAVKLNPDDVDARVTLGRILYESGDYVESAVQYRAASERDPRSGRIYNLMGVALEKSGNLALALESYRKAVQYAEASPELRFNLGKALAATGNTAEAIRSYEKAVALKPDFGPALANLGTLLLGCGRVTEAAKYLTDAVSKNASDPRLFNQLGLALARMGREREALEAFDRALTLKPDYAAAKKNREGLHKAAGK